MAIKNTLSLVLDCTTELLESVQRHVEPSDIVCVLTAKGFKWFEVPVPTGKVRIPVEDDAEFLLEGYEALELVYESKKDGVVDCVLKDGGLQIKWTKTGTEFVTNLLIVPFLDGRFAQRLTVSMDVESHMTTWRRIITPIYDAGASR